MNPDSDSSFGAWQPLTPRGVSQFAAASGWRLFVMLLVFGSIASGSVIWFAAHAWSPVIHNAIRHLPDGAALKQGRLEGVEPGILADGKFLSIIVDDSGESPSGVADVQLKFRKTLADVCSLLGCLSVNYPRDRELDLARRSSEPWWGAWEPMLLAGLGLASLLALMISWCALAGLYFAPVRLLAYFADRQLNGLGAWKLACAAQMPGALVMSSGIVLYGMQALDLIRLGFVFLIHFVVSWVYLAASPLFLPRLADAPPRDNPFGKKSSAEEPK